VCPFCHGDRSAIGRSRTLIGPIRRIRWGNNRFHSDANIALVHRAWADSTYIRDDLGTLKCVADPAGLRQASFIIGGKWRVPRGAVLEGVAIGADGLLLPARVALALAKFRKRIAKIVLGPSPVEGRSLVGVFVQGLAG
jgi:hypothetical protein